MQQLQQEVFLDASGCAGNTWISREMHAKCAKFTGQSARACHCAGIFLACRPCIHVHRQLLHEHQLDTPRHRFGSREVL